MIRVLRFWILCSGLGSFHLLQAMPCSSHSSLCFIIIINWDLTAFLHLPATDVAAEMAEVQTKLQDCETCSRAAMAALHMLAVSTYTHDVRVCEMRS